jgi:hypothetical protein
MCKDFAPIFGRCIMTAQHLTLPFLPSYFSLFPRLKIELKSLHFDIVEVTEAESQTGLNTFTEHDFQDAFKNVRSTGKGACA